MTDEKLLAVTAAAYLRLPEVEGMTCAPVFRNGTEAFVCHDKEDVIITFRGTDAPIDVLYDIDFRKTNLDNVPGKVHRGFKQALDNVRWQLLSKLHFHHDKNVYITGHSLGGALAVMFANWLDVMGRATRIERIVTFGAPRSHSALASSLYNFPLANRTIQFENWGDHITHVPFMLFDYRHVGQRVVLDVPTVRKRFRTWWLRLRNRFLTTRLQHPMSRYMITVRKWLAEGGVIAQKGT